MNEYCEGCPAWGEFLDNTRDYPCDGCKYAELKWAGDFDPFETQDPVAEEA